MAIMFSPWIEDTWSTIKEYKANPKLWQPRQFTIHWDSPEGINIEDPLLPDPTNEMFLRDVGIENIVDSFDIQMVNSQINVTWDESVLGQLIPEQRQVVRAHMAHILYEYIGCDSQTIKAYVIKANFHNDIQELANMEEEPGEFV